ncbi:MAG: hypothetical protein KIT57_09225 [Blastocatellales bacterium]|nr:hypothetical protein [Blastocatellales bacterium]
MFTLTIGKLTLALMLIAVVGLAQTHKEGSVMEQELQTVRIHIDGFSKSRSGAV